MADARRAPLKDQTDITGARVLIVEARFYDDIQDALLEGALAELKAAGPDDVRYMTLRLEDDTFIHMVETAADDGSSPIPKLAAFQAFQDGIRDRCAEPPLVRSAVIVGNYRMLDEP